MASSSERKLGIKSSAGSVMAMSRFTGMSARTHQGWHENAKTTFNEASASQGKAAAQHEISQRMQVTVASTRFELCDTMHNSLHYRVNLNQATLSKLQRRENSLATELRQTKHSLDMLKDAMRAKEAPWQLCIWRMRHREQRPMGEYVRDDVEFALEDEQSVLSEMHKSMSKLSNKTAAAIRTLQLKYEEVVAELQKYRRALKVDTECLKESQRVLQKCATANRAGQSPRFGGKINDDDGVRAEHMIKQLEEDAEILEEEARQRQRDIRGLLIHGDKVLGAAAGKLEQALNDRTGENQKVMKALKQQLQDTDDKIYETKKHISKTQGEIKLLEGPMDMYANCNSLRRARAAGEVATDSLSAAMNDHRSMLIQHFEDLKAQQAAERTTLHELTQTRSRLQDELQNKTCAMHIDLNCLAHEATYSNGRIVKKISKIKLGLAHAVDPSFVPKSNVDRQGYEDATLSAVRATVTNAGDTFKRSKSLGNRATSAKASFSPPARRSNASNTSSFRSSSAHKLSSRLETF